MDQRIVLKGAKLIDGRGKDAVENSCILIEGERIKKIGTVNDFDLSLYSYIVDLSGKTIMPGLINCHTHINMEPVADPFGLIAKESLAKTVIRGTVNLKKHLKSGVTYLRDLGSVGFSDIELRKSVAQGLIEGPEMLVSGKAITMTGGHGWQIGRECDGVHEVTKAAREQLKAGADVIKIMATGGVMTPGVEPGSPQLTYEEIRAAVEEAHRAGKRTATHAQGTKGIKNAVLAGIDSVEHGIFLDDEVIELMVQRGVYLVPTLVAPYFIVKYGVEAGIPKHMVEKSKRVMESHINSFRKAKESGVKIAMGTDAGTPFNFHDKSGYELKMMMEGGMTALEAIVASTKTASELLGIEQNYGTIEEGKIADILVLRDNPLENIETLLNVEGVYKKGTKVQLT